MLGSGGASVTVSAVLRDLGAASVTVISRSGPDNYENLERHADAQIIANTTPLGMYPNTGSAAVDLRAFPRCEGVFDIVYNPARTALLLQAEQLGIPCAGGLSMLVAQAKRSAELFLQRPIDPARTAAVTDALQKRMRSLILIGMPGAGKTTVGRLLAQRLGRDFFDADEELERRFGCDIPTFFAREGKAALPRRGDGPAGRAGQALRLRYRHGRRLRHPAGKRAAAAAERGRHLAAARA